MNQIQVILDIDEVYFDQAGAYQIIFQHQYSTELIRDVKNAPKYETNHFEIVTVAETPETLFLHVVIEDHQSGKAEIKAKTAIQISPSANFHQKEIVFTDGVTGFIFIKYKTISATSGRIIHSLHDKDYLLNVTAGYLNTLLENPYKLRITLLTQNMYHLSSLQLNNLHFHSVSKVNRKFGQEGLVVRIQELDVDQSHTFVTNVSTMAPSVIYITLFSGDILTVTLKFSDIDHTHIIGMIHSSVMREGSITTAVNEDKPRMTLTPRRKSSFATPRSSVRNSKIPGAMKQLLYLEDESVAEPTPASEILTRLGGHLTEGHLNLSSTVHPDPPPLLKSSIEANNGSFLLSTSRSEVIEEENGPKTKHLKRRELQNIVLGTLKLNKSYLTSPLKLRATLCDVLFLEHQQENEPEKTTRQPRAEFRYSGHLSETSREIFAESGLITCALEGKLYIHDSKLADDEVHNHLFDQITEKIMVFKVIISMIHYEGDKLEDVEEDPFKNTSTSALEESSPISLATNSIDTILRKAVEEHQEKIQKLQQQQEEKYNVVNEENQQPDELLGESEMNIPLIKQKLTPIPSEPPSHRASKEDIQLEQSESKQSIGVKENRGSKQSSGRNSKVSLHLELPQPEGEEIPSKVTSKQPSQQASNKNSHQTLPPPGSDLEDEYIENADQTRLSKNPSKAGSKQPSNNSSHRTLPAPGDELSNGLAQNPSKDASRPATKNPTRQTTRNPTRQPTANNSFEELPSLPSTNPPLAEELYTLHRNRTGELEGFSQAFGENITVEDIIKHRFSKDLRNKESLFPNGVEPNKKNVALFAEMIKEELLEKQKLIESLLQENKDKYKGIQLVGQDIKQLRDENNQLRAKIKELETGKLQYEDDKKRAETIVQDYLEPDKPLQPLSNTTLTHGLSKLYHDHKQLQQQHQQTAQSLQSEQQKLATIAKEKDDLQQQHQQLQSSHQELLSDFKQKKNEFDKLAYYQLTIQTQEKIIGKLQNLLESKMKNKFTFLKDGAAAGAPNAGSISHSLNSREHHELHQLRAMMAQQQKEQQLLAEQQQGKEDPSSGKSTAAQSNSNNEYEKLVQENYEKSSQLQSSQQEIVGLNNKVETLENRVQELEKALAEAEQQKNRPSSTASNRSEGDFNDIDIKEILEKNEFGQRPSSINNIKKANLTVDKLTAENISKGFKIDALEKQLETSSRESAREIARLRTKLFELEMGLAMATASVEDDDEGEMIQLQSANTSGKTNKSQINQPSKPPTASNNRVTIPPLNTASSAGRNTILRDFEEQFSNRSAEANPSNAANIHHPVIQHRSSQLPVNVEKPENSTIPSQLPHTEILRSESLLDIDHIPSLKHSSLGNPTVAVMPNNPSNHDILSEIMDDIDGGGKRKMSNVSTMSNHAKDKNQNNMLNQIMQEINEELI